MLKLVFEVVMLESSLELQRLYLEHLVFEVHKCSAYKNCMLFFKSSTYKVLAFNKIDNCTKIYMGTANVNKEVQQNRKL